MANGGGAWQGKVGACLWEGYLLCSLTAPGDLIRCARTRALPCRHFKTSHFLDPNWACGSNLPGSGFSMAPQVAEEVAIVGRVDGAF